MVWGWAGTRSVMFFFCVTLQTAQLGWYMRELGCDIRVIKQLNQSLHRFRCPQPKLTGRWENFLLLGGKHNWHLKSYLLANDPSLGWVRRMRILEVFDTGEECTSRNWRSLVSADLPLCAACGLLQCCFFLYNRTNIFLFCNYRAPEKKRNQNHQIKQVKVLQDST